MTTSLLISLSLLVSAPTPTTLDEDACIQRVLQKHADLQVADLQIESARTKLKELESTFYPKLQVTTWVAPMFRVNGNALEPTVDYQYESLSDWGPYLHFEARLVQILSTFGRFDTLKEAAELNTKVEEAKRQLVETSLLTETRRFDTRLPTRGQSRKDRRNNFGDTRQSPRVRQARIRRGDRRNHDDRSLPLRVRQEQSARLPSNARRADTAGRTRPKVSTSCPRPGRAQLQLREAPSPSVD